MAAAEVFNSALCHGGRSWVRNRRQTIGPRRGTAVCQGTLDQLSRTAAGTYV